MAEGITGGRLHVGVIFPTPVPGSITGFGTFLATL
jgi:hypothetical protein